MEPVSVRTWKISYYSYMFLHIFLVLGFFGDFRCSAQVLPNDEVQALHRISLKLRIAQWNVNKDSCVTSEDLNMEFRPEILSNVTCDCSFENSTLCHVTRITLNGMNATGELPNEFANLTYLSYIDLSRNFLYGSIPSRWGLLPLITLDLSENLINGTIPREMGNISTLEELNLQDNGIGGSLPQELGKLHALRIVILSSNNFQGSLPETFGNLKNLTDLIDGSSISGRIPGFIGNWTKLRWLGLQGTSMVGPIPSTISLLRNLVRLRITDLNTTNMSIPDLRNLENLVQLVLRNCSLNGSVPLYIGKKLLNLKKLDLSFNRLTGAIPENLGTLPNLSYMYLTNNSLDGEVPQWLSTGRSNILVDISYNNFTGVSQSSCGEKNMNKLSSYSSVKDNTINWCLKKDLPCPDKPRYYNLFINCGGPNLSFEGINYEQDLDGMGPASSFSTVKWASSCTGDFFTHDKILYIAEKSGNSAADLYLTARLAPLSLKYYGRCLRSGSYTVKLHFAEIMLRTDLRNNTVGKRIFDIYIQGARVWKDFNIAEEAGGIDIGIVKEFQANVTGNTLEIHLYWSGKGTISLPVKGVYGPLISAISVTPNFDPHTGLSIAIILGIVAGSAVAILLVLVALWRTGYLGRRDIDEELRGLLCYFTLGQIKAATGNFDTANKIGEGGFGPVYKGILSDGSAIAVKQLSPRSKQGNREFLNEIGMLSAVQHPNLVKLFGCCIEGNQLMLIYEYMANNSLHRALFEPRTTLDWPTRLKICMGIAKGLAYLHEESILKIVHRDMKASNVLLDKDLEAKISDFGLAKLDEEVNTHISTRIAGTVGYMAPEYAMRGYLTNKADIYSFGVVALEIISGKSNTSFRPKEEFVFLLDWAIVLQEQGNLLELIDPRLEPNYSEEEALKMINIALLCTNISPTLRPAMSSVVKMLEGQIPVQAPIVKGSSVTQDISDPSVKGISFDVSSNHHPFSLSSEEDIKSDSPTSKLLSDDESAYFTGLQA